MGSDCIVDVFNILLGITTGYVHTIPVMTNVRFFVIQNIQLQGPLPHSNA